MSCEKADPDPPALTDRQAYLALNAASGVSAIGRNRLLAAFGHPRAVLGAPPEAIDSVEGIRPGAGRSVAAWRREFDPAEEERKLEATGADFIAIGSAAYPAILREIPDPPIGLYRLGGYRFDRPTVAIVGTRRPTLYGRELARRFARELAEIGFCVVSGLARGIDTAAHEGALEAQGATVAVLGAGVDVTYPPENEGLQRRIAATGAVISEFPLGRRPDPGTFPMRNRIVSGLSRAVVVIESAADGGAMITARLADEQGRLLFAVPGRIDQPASVGCHQLIRDGATLLTCLAELLEGLAPIGGLPAGLAAAGSTGARPSAPAGEELSDDELTVLGGFSGGEILAPDAVAALTGIPVERVSPALLALELKGRVGRRLDGAYEAAGRR